MFMWVLLCTGVAYFLSAHVSSYASASMVAAQSSVAQGLAEIGGSDLEGLKFLVYYHTLDANVSFNNTIVKLHTSDGDTVSPQVSAYASILEAEKGDKLLIKNSGGSARAVKVE